MYNVQSLVTSMATAYQICCGFRKAMEFVYVSMESYIRASQNEKKKKRRNHMRSMRFSRCHFGIFFSHL